MNQKRRVFVFCSVIVFLFLSPLILPALAVSTLAIYNKIDAWRYQPTAEFSDARWKKPDLKYRYSVLRGVIEHQIRPGMTQNDVKARLGKPDSLVQGAWQYEARIPGWRWFEWQGGGLLVTFSDQNTVEYVKKNHWMD